MSTQAQPTPLPTDCPFLPAAQTRRYVKAMLWGASGAGKTHLSLQFPRPAVMDLEGSTALFSNRFQFNVMETKSYADLLDNLAWLERNPGHFETLVVDPVTVMVESLREGRLIVAARRSGKDAANLADDVGLTPRDWGDIKARFRNYMTRLVNLPMHIVLIARQRPEYAPGTEMRKIGDRPDSDGVTESYPDIVVQLRMQGSKRTALITKDRSGYLETGKEYKDPTFAVLFAPIIAGIAGGEHREQMTEDGAALRDSARLEQEESRTRQSTQAPLPSGRPTGATPAPAAPRGLCPVHNVPFVERHTTDKNGKVNSWWACPIRMGTNAEGKAVWCQEKPADSAAIERLLFKLFVRHGTNRKPLLDGTGKACWNPCASKYLQLAFAVKSPAEIEAIEYPTVIVALECELKERGLGGLAEWAPTAEQLARLTPTLADSGTEAHSHVPAQVAATPEPGAQAPERPETADASPSEAPAGAEGVGDSEMSRDEREGLIAFCKHAIGKDALDKFEPGALLEFYNAADPKPAMVRPFQLAKLNDGDLQRYANWLQMELDEKAQEARQ